ncbi:MAG: HDOD domain-containing protein [Chitinispirillia bacterium]|nr:HDOD domain-containing protein [Chitinispirillia bacterium]
MSSSPSPYTELQRRLQSLKALQTQPAAVAKITKMMQNPATNAEELGRAIRTDQVLTSSVLRLVNSAFYGFPGRIASISHAVVLLGLSAVKNIVLTASLLDAFKIDKNKDGFSSEAFWRHSFACGVTAQCLAQTLGYKDKEECFIAGLIHDIGKVILFQLVPEDFGRVYKKANLSKTLFYDNEMEVLGTTHQEVGGILIQQWRLPDDVFKAVSHHHCPNPNQDGFQLTAIVHTADIFARALCYGSGGDGKIPVINEDVWETLKLDSVSLVPLFDSIRVEMQKAGSFFSS